MGQAKVDELVAKEEGKGGRSYTGWMSKFLTSYAILFSAYHLLQVGGALRWLGIDIYTISHGAISQALILVYVFLTTPATKQSRQNRLPWYDGVLIALTLTVNLYVAVTIVKFLESAETATTLAQIFALIAVALILEACRRIVGWILSAIGILFFIYPFVADHMPALLYGKAYDLERIATTVYLSNAGIYGSIFQMVSTVIVIFVIFGSFLQTSGAGRFLIDLALGALGRYKGGPAKVAVLASCLFGTINGSAVANVASTGCITIPMMKSIGYRPYFAGAVEAVASTGGVIMPPVMGATIFLMMDFLGLSYVRLMAIALIPALLYYLSLLAMVHIEADKTGLKGIAPEKLPPVRRTLMDGWLYLLPVVVLLFLLIVLHYSPQTAGVYSIIAIVLVSWLKKGRGMGPRRIATALAGGIEGMPAVGTAVALGGMLSAAAAITGLGLRLGSGLVALTGDNLFLLLIVTWVACVFLGMFLPGVATYILSAIMLAPALTRMGVIPEAAHFFVLYMALSAVITPPVCVAAYVGATIAGAPLMRTGFESMRLGAVIYVVPFIFVYSPQILMIGDPLSIAFAAVTAILGIPFFAAALQGYLIRKANWLERVLLMAVALGMFIPGWKFSLPAAVMGTLLLLWQLRDRLFRSRKLESEIEYRKEKA
ncbi:MAG: TRAP transporter fused permease subunit [Chloroflexota bacterium]